MLLMSGFKHARPRPGANQSLTSLKSPTGARFRVGKTGWRNNQKKEIFMSQINMQEMLEAGMHFGHQTQRWNPKMRPYIYGSRSKIHIINLDKTLPLFNKAYDFMAKTAAKGGHILFVGTKRQAQEIVREEASRCGMYSVNNRWLGGMLTNFQTIRKSIDRLKSITAMQEDGSIHKYKKKEALMMEKELVKLERNLGGIKDMKGLPAALFIIDPKREKIAIEEATSPGHPGGGHGRYQLRSGSHRFPDSGQRRRHQVDQADHFPPGRCRPGRQEPAEGLQAARPKPPRTPIWPRPLRSTRTPRPKRPNRPAVYRFTGGRYPQRVTAAARFTPD